MYRNRPSKKSIPPGRNSKPPSAPTHPPPPPNSLRRSHHATPHPRSAAPNPLPPFIPDSLYVEQEQLSEDEDEVVPPKPKKKSHPPRAARAAVIDESDDEGADQEAKPVPEGPFRSHGHEVQEVESDGNNHRHNVSRRSASRASSIGSASSGAGNVPDTDYDDHPRRIVTKMKKKSARERKADKETIKLNESVYETTYHNHLAIIAKTHVGAKSATSILMHNVFKDVTQLRPGAGVPFTGGTLINIVEVPDSD
ncbi:hypothetical protein B0H14DRAFT_3529958 [Mycena olivaceomarginata]|nr:hypothetical protein B0H14DRAFT_3529958 [Mycena olivaceomarginata]